MPSRMDSLKQNRSGSATRSLMPFFQPVAGSVFFGSQGLGGAGDVENFEPYGRGKPSGKGGSECARQLKGLDAALVHQTGAGAPLRSTRDLYTAHENIMQHGVLETGLRHLVG